MLDAQHPSTSPLPGSGGAVVLTFADLLRKAEIDPAEVRLLRHQDASADAGRSPLALWRTDPAAFIEYQAHLDEIARTDAKRAHAVLLLDRAGWHTTDDLVVPNNMTLIFLPPHSPELNPVENVWQYLRANWLSNQVFQTYDDIIDAACDTRNKLIAQLDTIISIGWREWAVMGQT